MTSQADPILDLRELCREAPRTEAALRSLYFHLGWGMPFEDVLASALVSYITLGEDGLYRAKV